MSTAENIKRKSKTKLILIVCASVLVLTLGGFYVFQLLKDPTGVPPIVSGEKTTMKEVPSEGTPLDYSYEDNFAFLAGRLASVKSFSSVMKGTVNAPVAFFNYEQKVNGKRTVTPEYCFTQSLSTSSLKKVATQRYFHGKKAYIRSGKISGDGAQWSQKAPSVMDETAYLDLYGYVPREISEYAVNSKTIISCEKISAQNGKYVYKYELDPAVAPSAYGKEVKMVGGGKSNPYFSEVSITVTFDDEWYVEKVEKYEKYSIDLKGIGAINCVAQYVETFDYTASQDAEALEYFRKHLNTTGSTETENKDAADYLMEAFGGLVAGEVGYYDLKANILGQTIDAKLKLNLANTEIALDSAKFSVVYAGGEIKLRLGETALSLDTAELVEMIELPAIDLDTDALLEQMGGAEIVKDGEKVGISAQISLGGINIPLEFRLVEKDGAATLTEVSGKILLSGEEINLKLSPCSEFTTTMPIEVVECNDIARLIYGFKDSFAAKIKLAFEAAGQQIAVEGDADFRNGKLGATVVAKVADTELPANLYYEDGDVYITSALGNFTFPITDIISGGADTDIDVFGLIKSIFFEKKVITKFTAADGAIDIGLDLGAVKEGLPQISAYVNGEKLRIYGDNFDVELTAGGDVVAKPDLEYEAIEDIGGLIAAFAEAPAYLVDAEINCKLDETPLKARVYGKLVTDVLAVELQADIEIGGVKLNAKIVYSGLKVYISVGDFTFGIWATQIPDLIEFFNGLSPETQAISQVMDLPALDMGDTVLSFVDGAIGVKNDLISATLKPCDSTEITVPTKAAGLNELLALLEYVKQKSLTAEIDFAATVADTPVSFKGNLVCDFGAGAAAAKGVLGVGGISTAVELGYRSGVIYVKAENFGAYSIKAEELIGLLSGFGGDFAGLDLAALFKEVSCGNGISFILALGALNPSLPDVSVDIKSGVITAVTEGVSLKITSGGEVPAFEGEYDDLSGMVGAITALVNAKGYKAEATIPTAKGDVVINATIDRASKSLTADVSAMGIDLTAKLVDKAIYISVGGVTVKADVNDKDAIIALINNISPEVGAKVKDVLDKLTAGGKTEIPADVLSAISGILVGGDISVTANGVGITSEKVSLSVTAAEVSATTAPAKYITVERISGIIDWISAENFAAKVDATIGEVTVGGEIILSVAEKRVSGKINVNIAGNNIAVKLIATKETIYAEVLGKKVSIPTAEVLPEIKKLIGETNISIEQIIGILQNVTFDESKIDINLASLGAEMSVSFDGSSLTATGYGVTATITQTTATAEKATGEYDDLSGVTGAITALVNAKGYKAEATIPTAKGDVVINATIDRASKSLTANVSAMGIELTAKLVDKAIYISVGGITVKADINDKDTIIALINNISPEVGAKVKAVLDKLTAGGKTEIPADVLSAISGILVGGDITVNANGIGFVSEKVSLNVTAAEVSATTAPTKYLTVERISGIIDWISTDNFAAKVDATIGEVTVGGEIILSVAEKRVSGNINVNIAGNNIAVKLIATKETIYAEVLGKKVSIPTAEVLPEIKKLIGETNISIEQIIGILQNVTYDESKIDINLASLGAEMSVSFDGSKLTATGYGITATITQTTATAEKAVGEYDDLSGAIGAITALVNAKGYKAEATIPTAKGDVVINATIDRASKSLTANVSAMGVELTAKLVDKAIYLSVGGVTVKADVNDKDAIIALINKISPEVGAKVKDVLDKLTAGGKTEIPADIMTAISGILASGDISVTANGIGFVSEKVSLNVTAAEVSATTAPDKYLTVERISGIIDWISADNFSAKVDATIGEITVGGEIILSVAEKRISGNINVNIAGNSIAVKLIATKETIYAEVLGKKVSIPTAEVLPEIKKLIGETKIGIEQIIGILQNITFDESKIDINLASLGAEMSVSFDGSKLTATGYGVTATISQTTATAEKAVGEYDDLSGITGAITALVNAKGYKAEATIPTAKGDVVINATIDRASKSLTVNVSAMGVDFTAKLVDKAIYISVGGVTVKADVNDKDAIISLINKISPEVGAKVKDVLDKLTAGGKTEIPADVLTAISGILASGDISVNANGIGFASEKVSLNVTAAEVSATTAPAKYLTVERISGIIDWISADNFSAKVDATIGEITVGGEIILSVAEKRISGNINVNIAGNNVAVKLIATKETIYAEVLGKKVSIPTAEVLPEIKKLIGETKIGIEQIIGILQNVTFDESKIDINLASLGAEMSVSFDGSKLTATGYGVTATVTQTTATAEKAIGEYDDLSGAVSVVKEIITAKALVAAGTFELDVNGQKIALGIDLRADVKDLAAIKAAATVTVEYGARPAFRDEISLTYAGDLFIGYAGEVIKIGAGDKATLQAAYAALPEALRKIFENSSGEQLSIDPAAIKLSAANGEIHAETAGIKLGGMTIVGSLGVKGAAVAIEIPEFTRGAADIYNLAEFVGDVYEYVAVGKFSVSLNTELMRGADVIYRIKADVTAEVATKKVGIYAEVTDSKGVLHYIDAVIADGRIYCSYRSRADGEPMKLTMLYDSAKKLISGVLNISGTDKTPVEMIVELLLGETSVVVPSKYIAIGEISESKLGVTINGKSVIGAVLHRSATGLGGIDLSGLSISGVSLNPQIAVVEAREITVPTSTEGYLDISSLHVLIKDVEKAAAYKETGGYYLTGSAKANISLGSLDLIEIIVPLKIYVTFDNGKPVFTINLSVPATKVLVAAINGDTESTITIKDGTVYITRHQTSYYSGIFLSEKSCDRYEYRRMSMGDFTATIMDNIYFITNMSDTLSGLIDKQLNKEKDMEMHYEDIVKDYQFLDNKYHFLLDGAALALDRNINDISLDIFRSASGEDAAELVSLDAGIEMLGGLVSVSAHLDHTNIGQPADAQVAADNIARVNEQLG